MSSNEENPYELINNYRVSVRTEKLDQSTMYFYRQNWRESEGDTRCNQVVMIPLLKVFPRN